MKDFFKNLQTLLIVVLVAIILLNRNCEGKKSHPTEPTIITDTIVRYDTVRIEKINYVPKWKTKYITKVDTIPSDIDTLAILKDYYAKYFYTDTLHIDTLGYAVINDTISLNSILSRDIKTNILIPTSTITNTIYINKNEFYWGLSVYGRKNQISHLGGELLFKNKKHQVYGLGLGVNQNFKPVLGFKLYWKIGK